MIDSLKFIKGGVSKNELLSSTTHLQIKNNRITTYNGTFSISAPVSIDLNCNPHAISFVKCIDSCEEIISFSSGNKGDLNIKSGKFKANIKCSIEDGLCIIPEGEIISIDGERLISCLSMLYPFVSTNPIHTWAKSVLISKQSAFATNNICLVEYWLGDMFPIELSLPAITIVELVKLKQAPISMQICENSITFHYDGEKWIKTHLIAEKWPDIRKFLDGFSNQKEIPSDLFKGLETIKPFVNNLNQVFISKNRVSTTNNHETGVSFDVDMLDCSGIFSLDMLLLLKNRATSIDLTTWPKPCHFRGDNMRGAIIGMRDT